MVDRIKKLIPVYLCRNKQTVKQKTTIFQSKYYNIYKEKEKKKKAW